MTTNENETPDLTGKKKADPPDPGSLQSGKQRMILLTGGMFLIGLALALLFFGGPLRNRLKGEPAVELPQIPTPAGRSDSSNTALNPLAVGDQAHDFLLADLDGNEVALSTLKGRPLIINFWATWCAPCRLEMPELQRVYSTYKYDDLLVLAINQQEQEYQVRSFFDELGLTFMPLLDADGQVGRAYGTPGLPSTFFVDADGVVTAIHRGILTEGLIEDYLALTLQ